MHYEGRNASILLQRSLKETNKQNLRKLTDSHSYYHYLVLILDLRSITCKYHALCYSLEYMEFHYKSSGDFWEKMLKERERLIINLKQTCVC